MKTMDHREHQTIFLDNTNGSIQPMINFTRSSNCERNELVLVMVLGC